MKLVLAEKPSVAQSIAKVLGAAKREDGYLEGNGYVVSWCVGHLVELAQPEVYDAKYSKWAYADLPIFPMDWQYEVSAGTKKQFGILKKLMAREDVASLVCATDAGREGELIFRLVYHKAGCRKPFERLWISSMEDVAIKEGFENLRSGTEYDDYVWLWILCGLPFGLHRMCLWIVPGGGSLGGGIALFALNFIIGGVIGGFILAWRLIVAVWYVPLTVYRLIVG